MPRLTRWYIKSGLICFIAALALGVILSAPAIMPLPASIAVWGPVYVHLFMVGWMTQLIFGVVYWMFPRYTRERPRGDDTLAYVTFATLNVGLALRVLGEPQNALSPGTAWGWIVALSALLQWLAGVTFVLNTWARVKEK